MKAVPLIPLLTSANPHIIPGVLKLTHRSCCHIMNTKAARWNQPRKWPVVAVTGGYRWGGQTTRPKHPAKPHPSDWTLLFHWPRGHAANYFCVWVNVGGCCPFLACPLNVQFYPISSIHYSYFGAKFQLELFILLFNLIFIAREWVSQTQSWGKMTSKLFHSCWIEI